MKNKTKMRSFLKFLVYIGFSRIMPSIKSIAFSYC